MFDIHCHILYDVDDGSRSITESQAMLHAAQRAGIDTIVCTPHCRGGHFDYGRIVEHFDILREIAQSMGFNMALGFEVYWENLVEYGIENAHRLCIQDSNLLLLEFSVACMPANWERLIYSLQGTGVQPIIAHPERYRAVQKDIGIAHELKKMGCLLQLSGNFASGGFRSPSKRAAINLLEDNLVDYIASDAHCVQDYVDYENALRIAQKY